MIETDVTLGWVVPTEETDYAFHFSSDPEPIMARPPSKTSDLSLQEFLDTVINYYKPKGIKLDFKNVDVLDKASAILKARQSKVISPANICQFLQSVLRYRSPDSTRWLWMTQLSHESVNES